MRKEIGERLRFFRGETGLTSYAVAEKAGIPYEVYSAYERGRRLITARYLPAIAYALGISYEQILGSPVRGTRTAARIPRTAARRTRVAA